MYKRPPLYDAELFENLPTVLVTTVTVHTLFATYLYVQAGKPRLALYGAHS